MVYNFFEDFCVSCLVESDFINKRKSFNAI